MRKIASYIHLRLLALVIPLLVAPMLLSAQKALSLREAVEQAMQHNRSLAASRAAADASRARISIARSGTLPKINYAESWTRSNNPVFVFSSLLTQRQFTEQNFQLGPLNRPDALNNFQSLLSADQKIFDAGETRRAVRESELQRDLSLENTVQTERDVIARVAQCYLDTLLGEEQLRSAGQALLSAAASLEKAEAARDAGRSTEADVLSIRVHVAAVREVEIRRQAELEVARASLNDALGLELDTQQRLSMQLRPFPVAAASVEESEQSALARRPEARQAKLVLALAESGEAGARAARLPQVDLRIALEADRQRFVNRGGANWLVAVGLKWNLFDGFATRARIEERKFTVARREAEQEQVGSTLRLEVRRAHTALRSAAARIQVAAASVAEAAEGLRIIRDRYTAGLNTVTDLLRGETALLEARSREASAIHDQRLAALLVDYAAGTLSIDSAALQENAR